MDELFDFTISVQVLAQNRAEAKKFLEEETEKWKGTAFGQPSVPLDAFPPFVNDFEIKVDRSNTTWGDCPNTQCREYGRMKYGIRPGDECKECWSVLRAWNKAENRGYTREEMGIK